MNQAPSPSLRARLYGHVRRRHTDRWRARRMSDMVELTRLRDGSRVADLGGTEDLWRLLGRDLRVTLVNLPPADGRFTHVHADACDLGRLFEDRAFDFVFSNAVIEHVGGPDRQEAFAREARRLAPAYWVQTPSDRFPIESHSLVPFYWQLPGPVRDRIMSRWARTVPDWADFMRNTRALSRSRMAALFPDGNCYVERLMGLVKSYAFFRPVAR